MITRPLSPMVLVLTGGLVWCGLLIDPMLHSRAWEVTVGYGISLCIGYAIFLALVIPQGNGPRAAKECE